MTWDSVATHYDVGRCSACEVGNHTQGWASGSTVHWADRRITKLGLRRYLILIASLRLVKPVREYTRIYAYNVWAAQAARELRIRIPARYSDNDRARVRWLITKEENVPADVRRWARGRST